MPSAFNYGFSADAVLENDAGSPANPHTRPFLSMLQQAPTRAGSSPEHGGGVSRSGAASRRVSEHSLGLVQQLFRGKGMPAQHGLLVDACTFSLQQALGLIQHKAIEPELIIEVQQQLDVIDV